MISGYWLVVSFIWNLITLIVNDDDSDWFIGLYQHVVAGDRVHASEMVLATLKHITIRAKDQGLLHVILGGANSALEGGRWGY